MDRVSVYSGQVPRTLDMLMSQQNAMVGLAKLTEAVFGTATLADGFTCTPTTPASLNVLVTPGSLYQLENLEATTWSAVSSDTAHSIAKQGILLDAVTLGITPPGTTGFSQVYLIEVQYQDVDGGSTVLPYYNASNPASPYSGPGNAGTAQNTTRKGAVAVQLKAGVAATTGTQVAPTADAGWIGLFTVTVANGASTVTSGNIATLSTAPFLTTHGKLPQVPTAIQNSDWIYANDTGSANAMVVTLTPAPSAYTAGMLVSVKVANDVTGATTINVNGLGAKSVLVAGAALPASILKVGDIAGLWYDGTQFQLVAGGRFSYGTRRKLNSALTIYVNASTGNDTTGDGLTTGTAFQTITKAYSYAQSLDINGQVVTISCAAGTYTPCTLAGPVYGAGSSGTVSILANTGCTLTQTGTSGFAMTAFGGAMATFTGPWTFSSPSCTGNGGCWSVQTGAQIAIGTGGIHFGAAASGNQISSQVSGIVLLNGSYTIDNVSASRHFFASQGSIYSGGTGITITLTGTPSFSTAFVETNGGIGYVGMSGITISGSATGTRYLVSQYSWINTFGGGASYFPGSVAGSVTAGTYS
jgi:hypothetical protein